MKKKVVCLVIALAIVCAVFVGCSGTQTEEAPVSDVAETVEAAETTEEAPSEEAAADDTEAAEAAGETSVEAVDGPGTVPEGGSGYPRGNGDDTIKIGFACLQMSNTFHATVAKYFERECEARGIECMVLDDNFDGTTATENCQIIADAGCDAYVSVMGFLVGDAMYEICSEAGVLAIGMDQPIPNSPYFGSNNVVAGQLAGQTLAAEAVKKWGENPQIDLYISLENFAGDTINEQRMHEGMLTALRESLDITDDIVVACDVTDNDAQVAMRLVEDTITAHPEAEHILIGGFVDDSGQGAEAVIEKLGYQDKALISTVDGSTLAINNFQNPDTSWVCAAALTPEMYGYYMLETLEPYLRGETDVLPSSWYVSPVAITKDDYKEVLQEAIIYDDYVVE